MEISNASVLKCTCIMPANTVKQYFAPDVKAPDVAGS